MKTPKLKNPLTKLLSSIGSPEKYSTRRGSVNDYYLSEEIGSPSEYTAWFHEIRNADEKDVIRIHINSPGGNIFTTIQFLQAMADCEATIVVSVEGACMSAATLIMLCADHVQITNHSMFLFHNYSSFRYGKGGEMYSSMIHEKQWADAMMAEIYADFLTPDELLSITNDTDIWMDAREVMERLESRLETIKSRAVAEELVEEDASPQPQRRPRKPKK